MDALNFSDLSEEWVAQPRSSDPVEAKDDLALSTSTRSRIPIPSRRSVSSADSVLREKKASDVNVERQPAPSILPDIPPEAFSGTVQIHDAAQVAAIKQATPEWRKRLLKGKAQDMFSPIGLENVFRPPTVKNQTPHPARMKRIVTPSSILPSSPPVLRDQTQDESMLQFSEDSIQLPPMRAPSQTGPRHGSRRRATSGNSSNKSALHHERFSPVTLSNCRISTASKTLPSRHSSGYVTQERPRSPSSMSDSVLQIPALRADATPGMDSISLPEYSELDSEQLNLDSKFITTKRGGFSQDDCFKAKPLSPSSCQHPPPSSMPGSSVPTMHELPSTPARQKGLSTLDEELPQRQKSSGSPLKLFNNYDTYTNDRLSRRISQFEAVKDNEYISDSEGTPPTPSSRKIQALRRRKRMSSFGEGKLDKFSFTLQNDSEDAPQWPHGRSLGEGLKKALTENPQKLDDEFEPNGTQIVLDHSSDLAIVDHRQTALAVEQENKRGPSSPSKIPEAKRRRTLGNDEDSKEIIKVPHQRPSIPPGNSMAGKKRKDARRGEHSVIASPDVLAERQILDPVSPFRKLSRAFSKGGLADKDGVLDVNAATELLATELATLALNVAEDGSNGIRKKSVTTADFFREANLIMQHIRSKAARDSQQTSSVFTPNLPPIRASGPQDELYSEDELDRPASREGDSPSRKRKPVVLDKRVASQLRKFADSDDLGLALNSSLKMLQLQDLAQNEDLDSFDTERSDIRILDPRARPRGDSHGEQYETGRTQSTEGSNSTVPTGSSGTRNRATIEPHKVSHLIAETMGGMTFDHQKGCWVKRKSLEMDQTRVSRLGSELTDDDPFADIPDLDDDSPQRVKPSQPESSRPTTANTHADTGFASSGAEIETRATSWSTARLSKAAFTAQQRRQEQVIEESLLREGRAAPSQTSSHQPRAVTVAFSSPPARPVTPDQFLVDDLSDYDEHNELVWSTEAERIRTRNNLSSSVVRYMARPLSRIDESENSMELMGVDQTNRPEMSLHLQTPLPSNSPRRLNAPHANQSYVSMQLTPLPDFTIHQIDQSLDLDVQYVSRKQGLCNHHEIQDRFALSIKDLVAKIADIEPYEPYWEHMQELDLSNDGLFTLHMLDEFCSRLERLKVDGNELGQLNGVPSCIRNLSIRYNCLSDLTAWNHLYNLQYLDISGNKLRSLKGFSDLVHLRELTANNNQIESLDGICELDGLLKLSLAHNIIGEVDFEHARLPRLQELDLSDNRITRFANTNTLTSLRSLNLCKNKISSLNFDHEDENLNLKYLNLADNQLTAINVNPFVALKDIVLDWNKIQTIDGLKQRPNIERVSWRYQQFEEARRNDFCALIDYNCCIETRYLNLSGNKLDKFCLEGRFLNLARLDLASCGIKELDETFGNLVPNLRWLNLNHNAIEDARPLQGIKKLSHLFMVNNRLKDFRQVPRIISKLGGNLETLDCRGNPFNAGYYFAPKAPSKAMILATQDERKETEQDPFNDETFLEPDANVKKDSAYLKEIEYGISIRRRVYEMMLVQNCSRLTKLDGMTVDRERISNRDAIWDRLSALGIVPMKGI